MGQHQSMGRVSNTSNQAAAAAARAARRARRRLRLASHSPYLSAERHVMTLKSRHPPHTTRCTDLNPSRALSCSSTPSSAFCIAARLALSLSALHFIRHSRATFSKLTPSVIVGIVRSGGVVRGNKALLGVSARQSGPPEDPRAIDSPRSNPRSRHD